MASLKNLILGLSVAGLASAHPHRGHAGIAKRGSVPIDGTIITSCTTPGVVALTFDDGPYLYTQSIVDQVTAAGQRVSFFQNGLNWDSIYNYNSTLASMISGGHQICSHTWDHKDLATLTQAEIESEMTQLEVAYMNILGYFPTYMRPPYLSTNSLAITTLVSLGYKIIECDIDTQDWAEDPLGEVALSIQWYEGNQTAGGTVSLNHDPYQPTADTFLPTILAYLKAKNLQSVTIGECLGDDPINWYRNTRTGWASSSSSSASHSSTSSKVSSSTKTSSSVSSSVSASATKSSSTKTGSSSSTKTSSSYPVVSSSTKTSSSYPVASSSTKSSSSYPVVSSATKSSSSYPAVSSSTKTSSSWPVVSSSTKTSSSKPVASSSTKSSSSVAAAPSGVVSPDSTCGGTTGYVCPTGECCSAYGWCGTTTEYCGNGCQTTFGTCTAGTTSTGVTGTIDPTDNGTCGGSSGYVCPGGECCSQYGYCGTTTDYCSTGCQSTFGVCS